MLQATGTAAGQAQVPTDRIATSDDADDADDCRPGAPVDRRFGVAPAERLQKAVGERRGRPVAGR
jgi:hypothetical protein